MSNIVSYLPKINRQVMETAVRNPQKVLFPQRFRSSTISQSIGIETNPLLHRYLNKIFRYSRTDALKKTALVCDDEKSAAQLREDLLSILRSIISGNHSNSLDMFIQEQQIKRKCNRSHFIAVAKRFIVAINKDPEILRIDSLEGLIKRALKTQFKISFSGSLNLEKLVTELEEHIEKKTELLPSSKELSKGSSDDEYYIIEDKLHLCIDGIKKNWHKQKQSTLEHSLRLYRKDLIALLSIQAQVEEVYRNLCNSGEGLLQYSKLNVNDFKYGYKGGIGWYFLTGIQQDLFTKMKGRTLRNVDSQLIAPKHIQDRKKKKLVQSVKPGIEKIISKISQIQNIHSELLAVVEVMEKEMRKYYLFRGLDNQLQEAELLGSRINLIELDRLVSKMALNNAMPFSFDCQGGRLKHFVVDSAVESRSLNWTKILPLLDLSFDANSSSLELIDVLLGTNVCGRSGLKSGKRFPISTSEMRSVRIEKKVNPKRNSAILPKSDIFFKNKTEIRDKLETNHSTYWAKFASGSKSSSTRFKVKINSNTGVQFDYDLMVQKGNKIVLLDIIDEPDQAIEGVEKWRTMLKKVKPFVQSKLEYQQLDHKGELYSKSA